ncbi:MAG: PaaI family thioesterase [Sulfurovum sp.]|nr:PaaI family thioesterase [Sulfurovum sp.]
MKHSKPIDVVTLFTQKLGDTVDNFKLPPPIFEIMQCEIIDYDEAEKSLTIKLPVLEQWQNPFGTMQGGMIDAAIDNAVGPLSLLVAPTNVTRTINTKILKPITMELGYIYVKAKLVEQKKRRLTFEASVEDSEGVVYATSTLVNFIL